MALSMLITLALNLLSTMALKFDLNSAKVVSRLMALWHSKLIRVALSGSSWCAECHDRGIKKISDPYYNKNQRFLLSLTRWHPA